MVFYLKYRPQKIADLDLPEIREGLGKILSSGKIPHAFLFSGPRGSGKTSSARIVAKAVNCLKNKGKGEPCNKCSVCREINKGSFIDLIEIDGASNRGIDDVRNLRENVKLVSSRGRYKVYIIDEVHMLTKPAFNALLKTLEEPPEHVIFILCTTEPEKLPETIISRCVRFNFRKAKPDEIVEALQKVVKGEDLKLEKGVLELISKNVDGDFRSAKKVLDQLAADKGKIKLKEAKKLTGQLESLSPVALTKLLAEYNLELGLKEIDRIMKAGIDLQSYLQNLLELLRKELMIKLQVDKSSKSLTGLGLDEIKILIEIFSKAANQAKWAIVPQLPLELAFVEWCLDKNNQQSGLPQDRKDSKEKKENVDNANPNNGKIGLGEVKKAWTDVLQEVKPHNHSVTALLKACKPAKINGDVLTLEVLYRFHKERLETKKCRQVVEAAIEKVFGECVKIKCVLVKKKEKPKNGFSSSFLTSVEKIFKSKLVE